MVRICVVLACISSYEWRSHKEVCYYVVVSCMWVQHWQMRREAIASQQLLGLWELYSCTFVYQVCLCFSCAFSCFINPNLAGKEKIFIWFSQTLCGVLWGIWSTADQLEVCIIWIIHSIVVVSVVERLKVWVICACLPFPMLFFVLSLLGYFLISIYFHASIDFLTLTMLLAPFPFIYLKSLHVYWNILLQHCCARNLSICNKTWYCEDMDLRCQMYHLQWLYMSTLLVWLVLGKGCTC